MLSNEEDCDLLARATEEQREFGVKSGTTAPGCSTDKTRLELMFILYFITGI